MILSRLGFDQSIVWFTPKYDKSAVFWSSAIITTFFAMLIGVVFIFGIDFWSPELQVVKRAPQAFLLILGAYSIYYLASIALVSIRQGRAYLYQGAIMGSRVIFLYPLACFSSLGIVFSFGISLFLALLFSCHTLFRNGINRIGISRDFILKSFNYSAGNYVAGLFLLTPNQVLPLLVLNILGPQETAQYYLTFTLVSVLYMIPNAVSTSLFIEGAIMQISEKPLLNP